MLVEYETGYQLDDATGKSWVSIDVCFSFCLLMFILQENLNDFPAGLDGAQRLLVANSQAALQTMMNQQNAAMRGAAPLGGAPLILSPRLQVPTSLASGLLNGNGTAGPPPLIGKYYWLIIAACSASSDQKLHFQPLETQANFYTPNTPPQPLPQITQTIQDWLIHSWQPNTQQRILPVGCLLVEVFFVFASISIHISATVVVSVFVFKGKILFDRLYYLELYIQQNMQWSGYRLHTSIPSNPVFIPIIFIVSKTVSITNPPYIFILYIMFCEVFHSILFLSHISWRPVPQTQKRKKNLEIMSPETTRVSLESTVDILIRRPEQQNCIQCKSKKENQKR